MHCVGKQYQIGHSVFWDLKDDCSIEDLVNLIDLIIIPQIEEYCYDEDIAKKIFGESSPIISVHPYGVEIHSFRSLTPEQLKNAMEELLKND